MKSEYDPWYVNLASVAILIIVVVSSFFAVVYIISQSKLWLVPAVLVGIGIALIAVFSRIRRNILESLQPRIKYDRKALNQVFFIVSLVLMPILVGAIIFVLNYIKK